MKMKNYKIYYLPALAAILGFLIAWFIFKTPNTDNLKSDNTTESKTEVWTCSMHPQIRKDEPGDCPICGMDLIPANQNENANSNGFQMTEEAIKLANIQTTVIGAAGNIEGGSALKLNGKIQANETNSSSLVSHIPGRIEKLFVSFTGENVRKGQKIATIYSPELITAQKELLEAQKIENISPGLLAATKNKLKYWKIDNQVIEDILSSGKIKETFNIYADYSGVVSERRIKVGDYITTGEVLFDVQNLEKLWAIFDVYESDLPKINLGSQIIFSTPSAINKKFNAKIIFINPVIDPLTRVATIRAEIANQNGLLKPEMFLNAELNTINNKGQSEKLSVPKSAVLWTGKRSVVYVKLPDMEIPSFEFREIEIGESTSSGYEILSGLEFGEEVVTNGAFVIDASAQLNNQTSMMNRNVETKNSNNSDQLPDYTQTTPKLFKSQLSNLTEKYLLLKEAFVQSDTKMVLNTTKELLVKLEAVDMSLLSGKEHMYWMDLMKNIKQHSQKIIELESLKEQRKQFVFLSDNLIKALKVFGLEKDEIFVQYCPMFENGAFWLSKNKEILNPYFGKKMLKCGETKETIDVNFKNPKIENNTKTEVKQNIHNH